MTVTNITTRHCCCCRRRQMGLLGVTCSKHRTERIPSLSSARRCRLSRVPKTHATSHPWVECWFFGSCPFLRHHHPISPCSSSIMDGRFGIDFPYRSVWMTTDDQGRHHMECGTKHYRDRKLRKDNWIVSKWWWWWSVVRSVKWGFGVRSTSVEFFILCGRWTQVDRWCKIQFYFYVMNNSLLGFCCLCFHSFPWWCLGVSGVLNYHLHSKVCKIWTYVHRWYYKRGFYLIPV